MAELRLTLFAGAVTIRPAGDCFPQHVSCTQKARVAFSTSLLHQLRLNYLAELAKGLPLMANAAVCCGRKSGLINR